MTIRPHLFLLIALAVSVTSISTLLARRQSATGYWVPTRHQMRTAQHYFEGAFEAVRRGPDAPLPERDARALGLTLSAWHEGDAQGMLLHEPQGKGCNEGRGIYALRQKTARRHVAIFAPHSGYDQRTGTIAMRLVLEHGFTAAGWNSAPRVTSKSCHAAGDVAHTATHYMTAFSLAFAARYPGGRVVQLHGFAPAKRSGQNAQEADIIISNGTRQPNEILLDVADCLSRRLAGYRTSVFPVDTQELGALTNAQGRALRDAGHGNFIHVELSPAMRQNLADDAALRAQFAACLL